MTKIAAAHTLTFAKIEDVSGAALRVMDRVSKTSPWFACIVNGKRTEVRLGMKSGRVVAFRVA